MLSIGIVQNPMFGDGTPDGRARTNSLSAEKLHR